MPVLKIECPHCTAATRIDSDRLPDEAVTLPCPSCNGQVVLQKERLLAGEAPLPGDPPPGTESAVAPPPAPEPASVAAVPPRAVPPAVPPPAVENRPLLPPNFAIPEGTRLPSGILIGDDVVAMAAITEALEAWGSKLEVLASSSVAKQLEETSELQVYVAGRVEGPPYEPIAPLLDLPARERRRTFIVLVTDNLQTLDGNEAFLYEVNMVVNKRDLDKVAEYLYVALEFDRRLSGAHLAAEEALAQG